MALSPRPAAGDGTVAYTAMGRGRTFSMKVERETEITGPMAAKLFIASSTRDADRFLVVRLFDPQSRSLPDRPYHPHDREEPLTPGEVYECDVEIVTSCIVVPAAWTLALGVRGRDHEYEGELSEFARSFHYGTRGTGGMTHADPDDRPPAVFDNRVTLYSGGDRQFWLLLPVNSPR
jgi:hypothetical protein